MNPLGALAPHTFAHPQDLSMPPKRSAADSDTAATSKKFRSAIDETVSEFLCPITQELPLDPVTAEDGRVYERAAIEEWLSRPRKTSPTTNLAMGTKLLPAVQIRCVIEKLVRTGAITGDKAEKWQARLKDEEEFEDWRRRAESGDADAMFTLAGHYSHGIGVKQDRVQAEAWYLRSAQHGQLRGLTNCALYAGKEVHCKTDTDIVAHIMEAAVRGDAWACVKLGKWYAQGNRGFSKNLPLARRWYQKALTCTGVKADEDDRCQANEWLGANAEVQDLWMC